MNSVIKYTAFSVAFVIMSLFGWEYTALRLNQEFSPSVALNSISTFAVKFWRSCGHFVAWLSSFLTFFDFDDMLKAAENLWKPTWETLTSFVYFYAGYVSEMKLYDHPYLVTAGTIILVSLITYLSYYFGLLEYLVPVKNMISQYLPNFDNMVPSVDNQLKYANCINEQSPRRRRKHT